jgi:transcriptional regulator with XRE-family HTH domain
MFKKYKKGLMFMFGEYVKQERLKKDLSLREFCRRISYDAGNWSKIERGILPPPQDEETLTKIANVLNISDTTAKQELFDLSHISAGLLPPDFLSEKELVMSLPLFLRTVKNIKPTKEQLDNLINLMQKGI